MLQAKNFIKELQNNSIEFFSGVPDSLLKEFCSYIKENVEDKNNIITANEGSAIALGTGYYLATNKIPLIYMQNSGLGNIINPITSLVDPEVYSIPMLLLIGWRGEPNKEDEPQHIKKGRITLDILKVLEIPYEILSEDINIAKIQIEKAYEYMTKSSAPYALVVKKNTFETYNSEKDSEKYSLKREEALEIILNSMYSDDSAIISTTGKTSRELFELREKRNESHKFDFLTVGSMGHSSQIALGIALNSKKKIYSIDGDGAFIMHMGAITSIGSNKPKNFVHIVLNNGAHESVGGQKTTAFEIEIPNIAKSCGYKHTFSISNKEELKKKLEKIKNIEGPILIEIRIALGSRKDLGRPTKTPKENKIHFMRYLQNE